MKKTTQKSHLHKISAAIMFKRVEKNISAQTALTKEGFLPWGIIELTLRSVLPRMPLRRCCLHHARTRTMNQTFLMVEF